MKILGGLYDWFKQPVRYESGDTPVTKFQPPKSGVKRHGDRRDDLRGGGPNSHGIGPTPSQSVARADLKM